jgi:hypothetical protein
MLEDLAKREREREIERSPHIDYDCRN